MLEGIFSCFNVSDIYCMMLLVEYNIIYTNNTCWIIILVEYNIILVGIYDIAHLMSTTNELITVNDNICVMWYWNTRIGF